MALKEVPNIQKAIYYTSSTRVFLRNDAPVPIPEFSLGDHLIKVHTVALCANELLWNEWHPIPGKELVPGYDFCGTVVLSPPSSTFPPGCKVYGIPDFRRAGAAREYTIAKTEELALVPKGLRDEEIAAITLSARSAWQALFEKAGWIAEEGWAKGKTLVVTAASGGVGNWVVQLGRVVGANVVGTTGPANVDFVEELGATEVVNYRKSSLKEWAQGKSEEELADVVVTCVGGEAVRDAWYALKDGGAIIDIAGPAQPHDLKPEDVTVHPRAQEFFIMNPDAKNLDTISKWIEEGKVKPVVDSVYKLDDFEMAFEKSNGGHARGKVVMTL